MPPAPAELPVVIVGAGFSGTLLAINLLRRGDRVVVVERNGDSLARGLAFGTRRPEHLLNVRAENMSAFADDPAHFRRWMGFDTASKANRFVPRLAYGRYLRELLIDAMAANPGRLLVRNGEARDILPTADGIAVLLDTGAAIPARAAVLALGNAVPPAPPPFAALPPGLFHADPWAPGAAGGLDGIDDILLLGTGLTAIDATLALIGEGYAGRITALSRRGLVPRAHAWIGPAVAPVPRPRARGVALLRHVRVRAALVGWRVAIDELRPYTQAIWRDTPPAQQASFLRHLRPWWDVHRHRLAPQVNEQIAALAAAGRLRFATGKVRSVAVQAGAAAVTWRRRGSAAVQGGRFGRVIACTGVDCDIARADNPLLRALIARGLIRPDRHRLGIDVDHEGRVRGADGTGNPRVFAAGPLTKGEAWEIVAVPDIRQQVWALARLLSAGANVPA